MKKEEIIRMGVAMAILKVIKRNICWFDLMDLDEDNVYDKVEYMLSDEYSGKDIPVLVEYILKGIVSRDCFSIDNREVSFWLGEKKELNSRDQKWLIGYTTRLLGGDVPASMNPYEVIKNEIIEIIQTHINP